MAEDTSSDFKTFGAFLEAWGKVSLLQGREIATAIGIAPSTYNSWKSSKTVPPPELDNKLITLAGVFARATGEEVTPIQNEILGLTQNDRLKPKDQLNAERGWVAKKDRRRGLLYRKNLGLPHRYDLT